MSAPGSADGSRYLRALRRQPVDATPVWVMRQAGRYLPEYRAVRARVRDFLTLCKTPELACEVTLQPLRRFPLDAAIVFSDILTIPDAMGLGLRVQEGVGPTFAHPVRRLSDIRRLPAIDVREELRYVMQAVSLIRAELDSSIPLIGFSGSPWTLATYMVDGGGGKDFRYARGLLHAQPQAAHLLLEKNTAAVIDYLTAQVEAGVQSLMVFDTWGGLLSTPDYQAFSLHYMRQIVASLKADPTCREIPITLFTKGGGGWLEMIADSGCDAIGLDWTVPLDQARRRLGDRVALQGNMDPAVLFAANDKVAAEARRVVDEFGPGSGHIFNLGHGIHPQVDPQRVATLVDTVHHYSGR